ncbi:MAG: DEAD/DEAH box helicase [Candidatus Komeilibacteria bacterium]
MNQPQQPNQSFQTLGINQNILAILQRLEFVTPTPIQHKAIPIAVTGKDLIGVAQTGTGKTLAFVIPLIQRLQILGGLGLIVVPTRELAIQVEEVVEKLGRSLRMSSVVLIGGTDIRRQLAALNRNPQIIIATPGRLLDHISQRSVDLRRVKIVVLDEADRMFDMGFAPQIKRVMSALPDRRQVMLFSATMPDAIVKLATAYMELPLRIEVARAGTLTEKIEQEFLMVNKEEKIRLLDSLLGQYKGTVLVFSRTKHGAKRINQAVNAMGHRSTEIHSNRSLSQRQEAMRGFKTGKYRVLVATDIAARGIDVQDIELVVNFDMPEDPEDYVHRIGRTARAGQSGRAITFVSADQRGKVRDIERLTRTTVAMKRPATLAPVRPRAEEANLRFHPDRPEGRERPVGRSFSRGRRPSRGGVSEHTRAHSGGDSMIGKDHSFGRRRSMSTRRDSKRGLSGPRRAPSRYSR